MDLVSRVPHFPRPGQTIRGISFESHPGGKGANQAVAAARLQHAVDLIGAVGSDRIGLELLENLKREGVGTSHVGIVAGASGTATILVDERGENSIVVTPGANAALTPEIIRRKESAIRSAGLVLAQLEIPLETIAALSEICHNEGIPFMLDPAPALTLPSAILAKVSWFTPNETEAAFYVPNVSDVESLVDELSSLGPRNVILKRGAAGAAMKLSGLGMQTVGAPTVTPVDTTAAGDAFNAAFAVGLMTLDSPTEALRFAATAASISVTRAGAQPALAFRSEVEKMLQAEATQQSNA
jgi:ribokinase